MRERMMTESPNGRKPLQGPWTVGRHDVAVRSSPACGQPAAADHGQTVPPPDRSQEVQRADSSRGMKETHTVTLEPVANSVAKTGRIQLSPHANDRHRSSAVDWSVGTNDGAPVPVEAATRSPRFRILLLLLMLVLLSSVAIWTPEGLRAVAASTIGLLRSTDIPETRTAPGPGPLVGQLDVISAPSGIELYVDGELHGVTPVQLVLNAGTHQLTFVSPQGEVRRKVRVRPGHRTLFSEAIFPGSLVISSETGVEVQIDGRSFGTPGNRALMIAPGSYRVDLVNPKDGARTTHTVEIFPGQVTTLAARAPRGN